MWCHVRYLNCKGKNLFRITKEDKKNCKNINYDGTEFPVGKKDYFKISVMNKININGFSYEDKTIYPVYLSDQSFDDVLDLLFISNHYVLIKDFNRLTFDKNKSKNKKWFCKSCLKCFSSKIVLSSHKKDCLLINGGQRVKLEKGFIEFNNFNKMIPAPFKIYADFECLLKEVDIGINNEYRGAAHWKCKINLKTSKKIFVIFHNLRGYDSHLIFKELSKFNCNINVISNGLEKYMSFSLNKNIVFIDSMLFMNS